jgi:hypothetical protein
MPDLDMIVSMADYPEVKAYRDSLERDRNFPVGIEIYASICNFDFRPDEEVSYLRHRDLATPFPTRLFAPVQTMYLGESIITIDPLALFHTYVVLGGMLRTKDWPGAVGLARMAQSGHSQFAETDFEPFHHFLAERTRLYPSYRRYRTVANWVRYRVPSWMNYWGTYYGRYLMPIVFGNSDRPH